MIIIKPGVIFKKLLPEIYNTFEHLDGIFLRYGLDAVITSANDGKHEDGSLHYKDDAYDFRTKLLIHDYKMIVISELKHFLGKNYDIILENEGKENEHGHLEFDPKS